MELSRKKERKLRLPVRSSLSFFAFFSASRASTLLTTPIFTRLLTPEEYALTPLYYTWLSVFTTLATLELTGSILLSGLARHKENAEHYLAAATSLTLCPYGAVFLLYLLFHRRINALTGLPTHLMLLMFMQIGAGIVLSAVEARAKFFYSPKRALPSILSSALLSPALGFILVRSGVLRAEGRIVAAAIAATLVALPSLLFLYKRGGTFFDKAVWREQLRRALPLFPHYLALLTLAEVGRIFVGRFDTPDALAKLGVASTLSHAIPVVGAAINAAFYPWLLRRVGGGEMKKVREVTTIVVKVITFSAVCLILISPEFYSILAPKESYAEGLYATAPLILASIFAFLYTIVAGVNLERIKTSRVALTTLWCAVVCVLVTLPATLRFGFLGSALATALSYILLTVAHSLLLARKIGRQNTPLSLVRTTLSVSLILPAAFFAYYLQHLPAVRFLLLLVPLLLLLELALRSKVLFEN